MKIVRFAGICIEHFTVTKLNLFQADFVLTIRDFDFALHCMDFLVRELSMNLVNLMLSTRKLKQYIFMRHVHLN